MNPLLAQASVQGVENQAMQMITQPVPVAIVIVLLLIGGIIAPVLIKYMIKAAIEQTITDHLVNHSDFQAIKAQTKKHETELTELRGTYLNTFNQMLEAHQDTNRSKFDKLQEELHRVQIELTEVKSAIKYMQSWLNSKWGDK